MRKKLAVGVALVLGFSMLPISQASAKTFKTVLRSTRCTRVESHSH